MNIVQVFYIIKVILKTQYIYGGSENSNSKENIVYRTEFFERNLSLGSKKLEKIHAKIIDFLQTGVKNGQEQLMEDIHQFYFLIKKSIGDFFEKLLNISDDEKTGCIVNFLVKILTNQENNKLNDKEEQWKTKLILFFTNLNIELGYLKKEIEEYKEYEVLEIFKVNFFTPLASFEEVKNEFLEKFNEKKTLELYIKQESIDNTVDNEIKTTNTLESLNPIEGDWQIVVLGLVKYLLEGSYCFDQFYSFIMQLIITNDEELKLIKENLTIFITTLQNIKECVIKILKQENLYPLELPVEFEIS